MMSTQYLMEAARSGDYRLKHNGKTIWGGVGNPSGLHDFYFELAAQKWEKSGARFKKKLTKLSGIVEVYAFRNITRDRGRWVLVKRLEVNHDNATS